ncbi:3-methyl-2-oxobutanoate hydroxymethyltransferase [Dermacoccaceae bacterium W4C1]
MSKQTTSTTKRVRATHLRQMKDAGTKIVALTAYDFTTAALLDASGVDLLLIGDSIGNTMHGHQTTLPVTVDDLIAPARGVARAAQRAFVVVDLPFGSFEAGAEQALGTAIRFMKETGVQGVKIEGGQRVTAQIRAMSQAGIPVVGHLGYTPQSEHALGGPRVQGRSAAEELVADAHAIAEAGAIAVVLEMVPSPLAARLTEELEIPTIGIGAGAQCDGQILVWTDMAGMNDWTPKFVKEFGQVGQALRSAVGSYAEEVRGGTFPDAAHSFES